MALLIQLFGKRLLDIHRKDCELQAVVVHPRKDRMRIVKLASQKNRHSFLGGVDVSYILPDKLWQEIKILVLCCDAQHTSVPVNRYDLL